MEMSPPEKLNAKRSELTGRIRELKPTLCSDIKPATLVALVEDVLNPADESEAMVHDDVLFRLPLSQSLFDAWIVGKYAELTGAELARLSGDIWPDGVVTFQGRQQNVEVTEALMPGRRRGDEFRADRPRYGDGGPQAWDRIAGTVQVMLKQAISKKTEKNYSNPSVLVVLMQARDYGTRRKEIETHIHQCRFDAASPFEAVYVLWNDKLYKLERERAALHH